MRHSIAARQLASSQPVKGLLSFLLGLGLVLSLEGRLGAESPESAPVELKALLAQIDAAASRQDLERVMAFYSPNFTNADGLTYQALSQVLEDLWKRYPSLKYETELQSWETVDGEWVAQTLTTLRGTTQAGKQKKLLQSTLQSRQYFQGDKILRQEILSERTEVMAGANPPQVKVVLPDQIRAGEKFDFDVIVQDPLGDNLLAGAAIDETVQGDRYLNPSSFQLKLLQSGGLFKRGQAPEKPETHWISAILIREDGITLIARRVRFEK